MVMSLAASAKKDNTPLLPVTVDLTTNETNTPTPTSQGREKKERILVLQTRTLNKQHPKSRLSPTRPHRNQQTARRSQKTPNT